MRTGEGFSGGVVATRDMPSGEREMVLARDKDQVAHQMHGEGITRGTGVEYGHDGMVIAEKLDL